MTFQPGTYGQLSRDGTFRGIFTSLTSFEGRPECFVPASVDAQPAYDPLTQALTSTTTYAAGAVRTTWAITSLNQDALNLNGAKAGLAAQAQSMYTACKNHTITTNQIHLVLANLIQLVAQEHGITVS